MPLLRRHLTRIGHLSAVVEGLFVDDIQNNLWVDITTGRTGAGLCIGIVGCVLEIGDSINGIAVEHRIAAFIEQPQTVEELIDIAGGLVDINHDKLAFIGLLLQEVDDLLSVCG